MEGLQLSVIQRPATVASFGWLLSTQSLNSSTSNLIPRPTESESAF
jgi:hypothetical protein